MKLSANDNMPRIALVSNTDYSLYNFRMGLIRELQARGYEVHIICPDGDYIQEFVKQGLHHHAMYVDRKGLNPVHEARTLWQLYRIFKKGKFDLVHNFTTKINIYGDIAARFAAVPIVVNSVTGLGYVFTEGGIRKRLLRTLVVNLYRFAFKYAKKVIFLNEDDYRLFVRYRIVDGSKGILIKGEGVDVEKFSATNLSQDRLKLVNVELDINTIKRNPVVSMICRLLWDKGVKEYVEAARNLKQLYPDALFLLVGPIDRGNPAAVSEGFLEQAEKEGVIKYLGERRDIPEIMHISDVVVLPSYREGIPIVLLEAMSMGKPIVTTNSVGCRDVVEEGRNGFLVPIKDHAALASAIRKLIDNEELRVEMGRYGREKALREFDAKIIVDKIVLIYEELGQQSSGSRR